MEESQIKYNNNNNNSIINCKLWKIMLNIINHVLIVGVTFYITWLSRDFKKTVDWHLVLCTIGVSKRYL